MSRSTDALEQFGRAPSKKAQPASVLTLFAVPMLVKEQPIPIRQLTGPLSNPQQILQAFGLTGLA